MRSARLVATALLAGQVLFAVVVAVLQVDLGTTNLESLPYIAAGLALVSIPMAWAVRRALIQRSFALGKRQRLAKTLQAMIAAFAILEGAAVFSIVAWLITRNVAIAAPTVAVLIATQIVLFPRRNHFEF